MQKQQEKKLVMTNMLRKYLVKFCFRILVFILAFIFYIRHRQWTSDFLQSSFWTLDFARFQIGITPIHILWAIFMIIMVFHIFPRLGGKRTMAIRKAIERDYIPAQTYDGNKLLRYVQKSNIHAWEVLLAWLGFNAIFAVLYLVGIMEEADLLMLTVFYFLSDYICILLFCPFQTFFMHNRCCINCRIYDWGHFMMFTPMLFIKNFFSWSLFFTSVVVLIHWEIVYARHPERFWEGSNQSLQCRNCKDRTCQVKKKLARKS